MRRPHIDEFVPIVRANGVDGGWECMCGGGILMSVMERIQLWLTTSPSVNLSRIRANPLYLSSMLNRSRRCALFYIVTRDGCSQMYTQCAGGA